MKDVQEKESIMGVRGRLKNPSLAITVWHHSASLVMPDSDPRDGFLYLLTMIDLYNTLQRLYNTVRYNTVLDITRFKD